MSTTATQRDLSLTTIDDVIAEVTRLREGGYDKLGDWDLSQICQHIAEPAQRSVSGTLDFKVPFMVRLLRPLIRRSVFGSRKIRAGLKAPPGFEHAPMDEGEAVATFIDATRNFQTHDGPWPTHPVFGTMTTAQWHEFHVIHCQHHLSFLQPK